MEQILRIGSKILKVLAYVIMFAGTTLLALTIVLSRLTWADNWWRIVVIIAVGFAVACLAGILEHLSDEKKSKRLIDEP